MIDGYPKIDDGGNATFEDNDDSKSIDHEDNYIPKRRGDFGLPKKI
jgi:hypothetical protein